MRESQGGEAGRRVRLIATPVGRLLRGRPVVAQAVGLDHEPRSGQKKSTLKPFTCRCVNGGARPARRAIGRKRRSSSESVST